MNEITRQLNTEETMGNIARICNLKLEELRHYNTINYVFENVEVEEIEELHLYRCNFFVFIR